MGRRRGASIAADDWSRFLSDRISKIASERGSPPIFTFHHIGMPSHTGPGFDYEDPNELYEYASTYQQRSLLFTEFATEMINVLDKVDREKIVLFFGDHEMFVRRNLKPINLDLKVIDEHGILFVVIENDTKCTDKDFAIFSGDGFHTVERFLAGLFRCLASNPESIDGLVNFDEKFKFDHFVYE